MSDFRDRFGLQLTAASAALLAADGADFRVRFGLQLTQAAGELAAGRRPLAAPARRARSLRLPPLGFPPANHALARMLAGGDSRRSTGFRRI